MTISSSTFIQDIVKWVRNTLDTRVTDPISASRSGKDRFVMTSYPQRPVKYPIITVQQIGMDTSPLGMRSEVQAIRVILEIRIWARNIKEKDEIAQEVIDDLRTYQTDTSGSIVQDIHGFRVLSSTNVDELKEPKSKILEIEYLFIAG
jgi:hypothetical protein